MTSLQIHLERLNIFLSRKQQEHLIIIANGYVVETSAAPQFKVSYMHCVCLFNSSKF